ncbi:MAG: hypothetical protein N2Z59_01955 [Alteraurantiacibacter sp.]|nr:hypothetical protein [Alteraurantiacibacter sp.]
MAQAVHTIGKLPPLALEAAGMFHARFAGKLRKACEDLPEGSDLVLIFPPATHDHAAWREAAVQDLARAVAPHRRVNAVVGASGADIATVLAYLAAAPGVTGQVFLLDGSNGQDGNSAKSD